MTEFLNRCAFRVGSEGLVDFTVANAKTGFYIPSECQNPEVVDGGEYHYFAVSDDNLQHEEGNGIWDAGTSTLTRATIRNSSNGGGKVSFSVEPTVYMGGPSAEDIGDDAGILNVTGASGTFPIQSLVGIHTVNLLCEDSSAYLVNIPAGGFPAAGHNVLFRLSSDSDPGATVTFTGTKRVGNASVTPVLSSSGREIVMQRIPNNRWEVVNQNCQILLGSNGELFGVNLRQVDSYTFRPTEGSAITPYFPRVFIESSNEGAGINFSFNTSNLFAPGFVTFLQSYPGDSFNIDPSEFRMIDGSTPSAITFDTDGQCFTYFVRDSSTFTIISASSGVITP